MPDFKSFPLQQLSGARRTFGEANTSLWYDTVRRDPPLPAPKEHTRQCDVAIVGGGLTGLWTAYYLKRGNPSIKVAIFEANHVAFGASGRAGGWLIGILDGQHHHLAALDPPAKRAAASLVIDAVDEVGRVVHEEAIDCGYHKGGVVRIAARHQSQLQTLGKYRETITSEHGDDIATMLDAEGAGKALACRMPLGGLHLPHCAVVNPAQLALGLARKLVALGIPIHENCAVTSISPGLLQTDAGPCRARIIVPATEGYASILPVLSPYLIAPYSHIIATEPLAPGVRSSIGLSNGEAFADCSRMSTYGQVTADGRIVFGATGSYPKWGSKGAFSARYIEGRYNLVHKTMIDLLPQLANVEITHAWSGALGATRDFMPRVVEDTAAGIIWGGGYVGRGLTGSNLFGRTIADLAIGRETAYTTAPWVKRNSQLRDVLRRWEPEPLRTIGAKLATLPGELVERAYLASLPRPVGWVVSAVASLIPRAR